MTPEARPNRFPALIAAAALHAALFAAAVYAWPQETRPITLSAVPVQIVSAAPPTAPTIAPEPPGEVVPDVFEETVEVEAAAPPPPPEPAPPEPAPTPPAPAPRPVTPRPAPTPRPTPPKKETPAPARTPPKPTPPKPRPPRPAPSFDPSSIAESLSDAKARRPVSPPRPAEKSGGAAQTGPLSASGQASLNALTATLGEIWNPACVGDAADARPRVLFKISDDGQLVGQPRLRESSSNPAERAAAESALRAVRIGADRDLYDDLPPELYNREISITFRADQVCR